MTLPEYPATDLQQQELATDGYTILPDAIPAQLLGRLQELATRMESAALGAHARGERLHGACVIEDPVGPRLMRYDDVIAVDADAALELLACPAMMTVARDLCGQGTVPLQMDILYKHQHPHPVIQWHQGAPHPRGYPYLNVGVYLDDADENDGCLKYVPETQHELQDICDLSERHGWYIPGTVEQPARAGDILVQDMMILHGSAPKISPGTRRTIYIELRPAAGIRESKSQSEHWLFLRQRWMGLVVRRAAPSAWPAQWCKELPADLGSDATEVAAITAHWEPPIPAVYCYRPIETDGYPIPANARALELQQDG